MVYIVPISCSLFWPKLGGRAGARIISIPFPPTLFFCSPPPWFPHKKLFVVAISGLDNLGIGITWNKDEIEAQKVKA